MKLLFKTVILSLLAILFADSAQASYSTKGIVRRGDLLYQNQLFTPQDMENLNRGHAKGRVQTWYGAKEYCQNLTLGGYYNWRVPTKRELGKIIKKWRHKTASGDYMYLPRLFSKRFQSIGYVWSANKANSYDATYIDFSSGTVEEGSKHDTFLVLCVHDYKPQKRKNSTKRYDRYDPKKIAKIFDLQYLQDFHSDAVKEFKKLYVSSNYKNIIAEAALLLNRQSIKHSKRDTAKMLKKLADTGDVYAQYYYARFLRAGLGVPVNIDKSIYYLKKAAASKVLHGEAIYQLLFSYDQCARKAGCQALRGVDAYSLLKETSLEALALGHRNAKITYDKNFNDNGRSWAFWQDKVSEDAYIYSRYKSKKLDAELRMGWEDGVPVFHFLINRDLSKLSNITLDDTYVLEVDKGWIKNCNLFSRCIEDSISYPEKKEMLLSFKDFDNLGKYRKKFLNHNYITIYYILRNGKKLNFTFKLENQSLRKAFDKLIKFRQTHTLEKSTFPNSIYDRIDVTKLFIDLRNTKKPAKKRYKKASQNDELDLRTIKSNRKGVFDSFNDGSLFKNW